MRWLAGFAATIFLLQGAAVRPARAEATPPSWRSLETAHYTVLSEVDDRTTRAWAAQLDQYIASLAPVLGVPPQLLPHQTFVLIGRDSPLALHVRDADCRNRFPAGHAIGVLVDDPAAHRAALHDAAHWIASAAPDTLPRWYLEGVAELYSTFDVRGASVRWGMPIDAHARLLRDSELLAPEALFAPGNDAALSLAQSWALAHLLLLGGEDPQGTARAVAPQLQPESMRAALRSYLAQPRLPTASRPRLLVEKKYVLTHADAQQVQLSLGRLAAAERP